MRLIALCVLPLLGAMLSFGVPAAQAARVRVAGLIAVALVHLTLVASLWMNPAPSALSGWLAADPLGLIVLTLTSTVFLVIAIYTVGYLRRERPRGGRLFVSGLLAFLGAASVVALSQHLAMLWVGIEATTLSLAPLIYHRHDRRSLEAVWKYLVLSSVGIALALLGIFFLATAQAGVPGRPLVMADLVARATDLHPAWLEASFIFLIVGFGTKMGLAPMHTWKPDTYGEAPSLVSGLMAGTLTSSAFLGVARITQVSMAAQLSAFIQPVLLGFGILSLAVAAAFMIAQSDVKRLLAYSSVEHMGLLMLGLGVGGAGMYGTMLHVLNNGLAKAWLFLVVGNVVLASGSSAASANRGILRKLPVSGALLVLGLFAVTGAPPFGLFLSEFTILRAAITSWHPWVAVIMLLLLAIIFVGMASIILEMAFGDTQQTTPRSHESPWLVLGPTALAGAVLLLGVHIPRALHDVLVRAAASLGGMSP
jgi:hydrogenase-4 component F